MRTIYKYPLTIFGTREIPLPENAIVVHAEMQHGNLTIWVEQDLADGLVNRTFSVYGTGHQINSDAEHIATVIDGEMVWHIYERGIHE